MATSALLLIFPSLMIFAAVNDVLTMRIANTVSLGLVLLFVGAALTAGMPLQVMLVHLGVAAAVLVATMVLFQLRLFGGGDAKLLAAASLWVGYQQLLPFLVWVTLFGGVLAVLMLAYRSVPAAVLPLPDWALRLHKRGEGIPYGVAISAGALVVYPMTTIPLLLGH